MAKRARPRFKRGDRVEWTDAACAKRRTGSVADVHKLGGYGFHYEVTPDPGQGPWAAPVEVEEAALAHESLLERVAQAAAEPMRTGLPKSKGRPKK